MPKPIRMTRDEAEERIGRGSTLKSAWRTVSGIESLTAAVSTSTRRYGSGSAIKPKFKQKKMPAPSERSHRKHGTSRTTVHKSSKIESGHRRGHSHRHRSREAEPDSEDDYVYPRETRERRKAPHVERQRYEEVRRLGRDGEEHEADADASQDEKHARAERARRSRTKSSHHHHHHHCHRRDEEERPRVHRTHRARTDEELRQRDEKKRNRGAAGEAEHHRRTSSPRGRHEHRVEGNTSFLSKLVPNIFGKRSKSVPAPPSPHRPRTKRNLSDPVLASPRHELRVPECDDIARQHVPEKHKSERKKDNHTSILAGMFGAPAAKVKEPAPVKVVKLVSCVVCMDDDVKSTKAPKLKCGHRMCHSCLRRSFKLSIKDPQQMPPKCCTADQIPLKTVDKLFPNEWKKKWHRKYEEYSTKNRIYCPAKACGEWIRPDDIKKVEGKKQGVCRKCKTKVCGTCNAKWHGARECPKDAETNALLETAREAGWQRCYSCRTLVELKEGCNHMTCRCTAEFCMLCGLKWRTCECPWFNYETIEADRLAHMRPVDEDALLGRPDLPAVFPRQPRANANLNNPVPNPNDAFFPPPPRPPQAHAPAMPVLDMAPQQPVHVFAVVGQIMNQQINAQQHQAQARAQQREHYRQFFRQQQQLDERQRQFRADEDLARTMARVELENNEPIERPRRRMRQPSLAGSEAPASVQAGLGGPGRRRGSDRVDGWIQFVQPEVRAVPVR